MNKRGSLIIISLIALVVIVGIIVIIKSASITGNALFERGTRRTIIESPSISPISNLTNHRHVTDPFTVIAHASKTGGQEIASNVYAASFWTSKVDCAREASVKKLFFPQGTNFIVLESGYLLESLSPAIDLSGVVVYQDFAFLSTPTSQSSDAYYFKASDPQNKLKSSIVYVTCATIEPTSHSFSDKDY